MSKESLKTLQVVISEECWIELGVLRLRTKKKSVQDVIREILETYTNKLIKKNVDNIAQQ